MSFDRGWRSRRAAFRHRADRAKLGMTEYGRWIAEQREAERRLLRGEPPLTTEPTQQGETSAEAKARRERDAIVLPTTIEDVEAEAEARMDIDTRKLN